jgi:crotonobetainyl-CoA:carnitine CoA-transferase CaiB-like acyl-CoA transferase
MGACSGLRIVELGSMVTAPLTGQLLADFGAEVIKIEPIGGEIMRGIPPIYEGRSAAFGQWNRNKKSVTLNLKNAAELDAARRIVASADAVVTNYRADTLAGFGLDYSSVSKASPHLVYASITGFGPDGPHADYSSYDMVIQGLVGLMPHQGNEGPPQPIRSAVADKVVAHSAAMSILAAILHRKNSGEGQLIEISMLDAYANFILPELFYTHTFLDAPPPVQWVKSIYNQFEVSDGWVIGFLMTDRHFEGACTALGIEALRDDPRFADPGMRNVYQPELMQEIKKACGHMTVGEFIDLARANDLPFAPVNTLEQFMNDPQAINNETFVEFVDPARPELGRIRLLNNCVRMHGTPINARAFAPDAGEHTEEVLTSIGLSGGELRA